MLEYISGHDYPTKVIPLIEQAKNSIKIIMFEWRWYPESPGRSPQIFNQAIIRAARRGVQIEAVTNNDQMKKILNENGIKARRLYSRNLMHCKLLIVDEKIVVTGSHNITQSGFEKNIEFSVIVEDNYQNNEAVKYFNKLYAIT